MPREQNVIEVGRDLGKVGKLGAVRNQGCFDRKLGGDAVAVLLDAVEAGKFGLVE